MPFTSMRGITTSTAIALGAISAIIALVIAYPDRFIELLLIGSNCVFIILTALFYINWISLADFDRTKDHEWPIRIRREVRPTSNKEIVVGPLFVSNDNQLRLVISSPVDFNLIVEYKKGGKTTKIDKPLTREYDDCFEGTGGRAYTFRVRPGRSSINLLRIAIYEIELASRRFSAVGSR